MDPIVETTHGKLEGSQRGADRANQADQAYQAYRGIPFAMPPIGELRFRAPVLPEPWGGVRDATRFGPSAPQNKVDFDLVPGLDVGPQSEDCLYLNVLTPGADASRRPVMVWIHGGAFTSGSGSQQMYDFRPLVGRGDVVVVSLNYRLGAFGFLHLEELLGADYQGSGNAGMLDQVAALEWVRDNIERFGGDPENVTVFGESAGGMAVGTLLGLPAAQGLFARAIPQSGAAHAINSARDASAVATAFLEELACDKASPGAARGYQALLREASVEELLAAQARCISRFERAGNTRSFRPVVDGSVLPRPPLEAIQRGSARDVAVMVGCTRDECKLFGFQDPQLKELDEATLGERMEARVPGLDEAGKTLASSLVASYRRARKGRSDRAGSSGAESLSAREIFLALETDRLFRIPAIRLAEAQLRSGAPTYAYLVSYESPLLDGALGACHGIDMPFVLGAAGSKAAEMFAGSGPDVERLTLAMMHAWLAFARSGDPNHEALPLWTQYDEERRPTMVFDRESALEDDPLGAERRAWQGIL